MLNAYPDSTNRGELVGSGSAGFSGSFEHDSSGGEPLKHGCLECRSATAEGELHPSAE